MKRLIALMLMLLPVSGWAASNPFDDIPDRANATRILASWFNTIKAAGQQLSSTDSFHVTLVLGTNTSIADTAALEVNSTTLGILFPRLTESQRDAISSPATWLMVLNTDQSTMDYYTGSLWQFMDGLRPEVDPGEVSGSVTVDLADGSSHTLTLAGNSTVALSNYRSGRAYILRINQNSTSAAYTVNWADTILWPGGTAPTITPNSTYGDIINLFRTSDDQWYGSYSQDFQ